MSVLAVQGLTGRVGNGDGHVLYRELALRCEPGQVLVVIGPNGAGKTTLLRQLVALLPCDRGEITLDGVAVERIPLRERAKRIAYLPQRHGTWLEMTVEEVVRLGRAPYLGLFDRLGAEDRAAVDEALHAADVAGLVGRKITALSGGELQRVMLARMLCTRAPVLVLDEPTTGLDVGHALALLELLRSLARAGRAVVTAMHELELSRRYADLALLLHGVEGTYDFGEVERVFDPEKLAATFGVGVRLGPDGLAFAPR